MDVLKDRIRVSEQMRIDEKNKDNQNIGQIKDKLKQTQNKNDMTEKSIHHIRDTLVAEENARQSEDKQAQILVTELRNQFEQEKVSHSQAQKKVQEMGSALDEAKIKSEGIKDELRILNEQITVKNLDMVASQKRINKLNSEMVQAQSVSEK
jgi:chromosome segregation ATPase